MPKWFEETNMIEISCLAGHVFRAPASSNYQPALQVWAVMHRDCHAVANTPENKLEQAAQEVVRSLGVPLDVARSYIAHEAELFPEQWGLK